MIVHREPQPVHATGPKNVHRPPDDPRIEVFRTLLRAIDASDAKAGIVATKQLRQEFNLSVVILPPRGQGAVR